MKQVLHDEAATQQLGQALAQCITAPLRLYFYGELGAGKTCMIRAMLRALGIEGPIKSPTFALVEPYQNDTLHLFHFDLYRLSEPEELEALGWRDYLTDDSVILLEWPEKGGAILPEPDLALHLSIIPEGRNVDCRAHTEKGQQIVKKLVTIRA